MATNNGKKALQRGARQIAKSDPITRGATRALTGKQTGNASNVLKKGKDPLKHKDKFTSQVISAGKRAKSYKDLINMDPGDVMKMSTGDLRSVVARLNRIETKRVNNLEKYGYNTQAIRALKETGGKTVAAKDMSRNQLLHEYSRAKAFLSAETSTVSGSAKFYKGIKERVGANRYLSDQEIEQLYDILDKFMETKAIQFYKKGASQSQGYSESVGAQKKIWELMAQGKNEDEILLELGELDLTAYAAQQDTSENFIGIGRGNPW